jgi:hypothetical protein
VGLAVSRPPEVTRRELRGVQVDPSLSLAAKGLLHELLMRPPAAVLTRAELFEINRDPMNAIDAAIEELACAGLAVKVPPRKRSQSRRSGGIKLTAPAVGQPQPEPDLDGAPVIGARPAPPWWEWQGWPVSPNEVAVLRPFRGRMVGSEGRG